MNWDQLHRRIKKGESRAFTEFVLATQDKLFNFCVYLTGDRTKAGDLAQDTYVRAVQKIAQVTEPSKMPSWLLTIARNEFLMEKRKGQSKIQSKIQRPTEENPDPLEKIEDPKSTDVATFMSVQSALMQLSPEDREVLLLVDQQELSYEEAAEILGIGLGALKSRVHRARKEFINVYKD